MEKQFIITLGREFGSGGSYIAQRIADKFGIELLYKEFLDDVAFHSGYDGDHIRMHDEKPKRVFLSRTVGNYSNSLEEHFAYKVFDFIRHKADSGASFIVVGRCGEYVLKDYDNVFNIFVCADMEAKVERISQIFEIPPRKASFLIRETDRKRKTYHNYYSDQKWGSSLAYDIIINTTKLGIEKTADVLLGYVQAYIEAHA